MIELVKFKSPLRVLVVDDSSLYRQMLMRAIAEVDGVEVIDCACDGIEALEKIERLQPDLLTLDVQMPKLDGLGVLREIKQRSIEIIVLVVSNVTAEGAPATVDALLNGAMDCILKPSGLDAKAERHDTAEVLNDYNDTTSIANPSAAVTNSTTYSDGIPVTALAAARPSGRPRSEFGISDNQGGQTVDLLKVIASAPYGVV